MTELGIDHLADVRAIGQGGFSTVYAARHTLFQRPVAVKVLSELAKEKDQRRFERECEVMGRMSDHPNVVTVYQAGYTTDGSPYLIMELVEGGTLADLLARRGQLPWRESVELIAPVCGALARAHDEGILHRDVKPENILVAADGSPKLTDFGIAYLRDATGATSTQITASWLHTAPETFENRRDERSDLYSLASTLHNLITGTAPFWRPDDESLSPLMMRLVSEQPPALPPELAPEGLANLVLRTLAKDPEQRPQRASDLADELDAVIAGDLPSTDAGSDTLLRGGSPIDASWDPPATRAAPSLDFPPPHLPSETVAAPASSPATTEAPKTATAVASRAEHPAPPPSDRHPSDGPSPIPHDRPSSGPQTLATVGLVLFRIGHAAFIVALVATVSFVHEDPVVLGRSLAALAVGVAIGSWLSHQLAAQLPIGKLMALGSGLAMLGTVLIRVTAGGANMANLGLGIVLVGIGIGVGSVQAASMSGLDGTSRQPVLRVGSVVGAIMGAMLAGAIIRGSGWYTEVLPAISVVLAVAAIVAAVSKETPAPSASATARIDGHRPPTSLNVIGLSGFTSFTGGLLFFVLLISVFERPDAFGSHLTMAGFGLGYFGLYAATGFSRKLPGSTKGHLVVATGLLVASGAWYLWIESGHPEQAIVGMVACGVALAAGTDWASGGWGLWLGQLTAGAGALVASEWLGRFGYQSVAAAGAIGAVVIVTWGMLSSNGATSAGTTATGSATESGPT